jgi:hypothetical protein
MGGSVLAGMWCEREAKKQNFSFFPCCTFRGRRKRNSIVQNDAVLEFFFLKKNMKRCCFGQNAPFHLNKARRHNASNFKSALNYLLFISIASLSISVSAPIVGHIFHFSPWPLIYAIGPSIDQ